MNQCRIRIEHLCLAGCRRNSGRALVKEIRSDRSVIHKLVSTVRKFNRNALRISALGSVAVRIEVRIHPDTHDRFHIDRVGIVLCLQLESETIVTAVKGCAVI